MKIPSELNITGMRWRVEESEDVSRQGNTYGTTHFLSQKIILRPGMARDLQEETLLHELIHVCMCQSGLSERLERVKETVTEEELVRAISTVLYQALKDNRIVFKGAKV